MVDESPRKKSDTNGLIMATGKTIRLFTANDKSKKGDLGLRSPFFVIETKRYAVLAAFTPTKEK